MQISALYLVHLSMCAASRTNALLNSLPDARYANSDGCAA